MKIRLLNDGPERTWAVVFAPGDEAIEGLGRVASWQRLSGARLTAIGAFESATLAWFDLEAREYRPIEVDEQVEVVSLVGNVALAPDGPKVHAHCVVARRDGTALGGHLLAGRVRPTLEVVLVESPGHLRRTTDAATGLPLLDLG